MQVITPLRRLGIEVAVINVMRPTAAPGLYTILRVRDLSFRSFPTCGGH